VRCRVEATFPGFTRLVSRLKAKGYPHVESDLAEAFKAIEGNRLAKNGRAVPHFKELIWKYRQNSKDIRRGASYGWRIIAYYDAERNTVYPILLYPKTQQDDVAGGSITEATQQLKEYLAHERSAGAGDPQVGG
jgi:hypothetical protein